MPSQHIHIPEKDTGMKNHVDEHEAFAASRSSEHVYVPIDDKNFTTLDKHAETIEMDSKLPLVRRDRCNEHTLRFCRRNMQRDQLSYTPTTTGSYRSADLLRVFIMWYSWYYRCEPRKAQFELHRVVV